MILRIDFLLRKMQAIKDSSFVTIAHIHYKDDLSPGKGRIRTFVDAFAPTFASEIGIGVFASEANAASSTGTVVGATGCTTVGAHSLHRSIEVHANAVTSFTCCRITCMICIITVYNYILCVLLYKSLCSRCAGI